MRRAPDKIMGKIRHIMTELSPLFTSVFFPLLVCFKIQSVSHDFVRSSSSRALIFGIILGANL